MMCLHIADIGVTVCAAFDRTVVHYSAVRDHMFFKAAFILEAFSTVFCLTEKRVNSFVFFNVIIQLAFKGILFTAFFTHIFTVPMPVLMSMQGTWDVEFLWADGTLNFTMIFNMVGIKWFLGVSYMIAKFTFEFAGTFSFYQCHCFIRSPALLLIGDFGWVVLLGSWAVWLSGSLCGGLSFSLVPVSALFFTFRGFCVFYFVCHLVMYFEPVLAWEAFVV